MDLHDERIDALMTMIKDSFRVRPNQDPVYVEVGDNLARVTAKQHQVIFGRRGSGKSCLLVHFHRTVGPRENIKTIYIEADPIKRLGYPDILIRLLLTITEQLPGRRRGWLRKLIRRPPIALEAQATELRNLLDLAEQSDVTEESKQGEEHRAEAQLKQGPVSVGGNSPVAAALPAPRCLERRSSIPLSVTLPTTSALSARLCRK
jgi:hypothetical protein